MSQEDQIIDTLLALDSLADLPRTGWRLQGVRPCESVADHSWGVGVLTMLLVDGLRSEGHTVDGERALRMALLHDATEARTGDIPMPSKTAGLAAAMTELEEGLARDLLPESLMEAWQEAEQGQSLEARIVRAADKLQMMIKVLAYQRQGRGDLKQFWNNPNNFRTMGLALVERVYARLRARALGPSS